MHVFSESVEILGPVCRLVGQGFGDREIAKKLNRTELDVQDCIASTMHFLKFKDRIELIHYASARITL